jgi:EpsI family protein
MVAEYPLEEEVQKVLRADDTLNRSYASAGQVPLNLFMAYFKSQKTGVAPHSPKNCLPGSGWAPLSSDTTKVQIPGRSEPLEVNRFIVARGTEKTLVLYWYQTAYRVIASEYEAKIWLVIDSLVHRRSDTAIVRVVAPLPEGREGEIDRLTTEFIAAAFPAVSRQIPQ